MRRTSLNGRGLVAGLTAALAAVLLAVPIQDDRASAADTPVTVSVTPTEGLEDGDVVTAVIRTTADYRVFEAQVRLCRAGVEYADGDANSPNRDFDPANGNCPS